MPYIKSEDRDRLAEGEMPENKGEINYMCYTLGKAYIDTHGANYQNISDAIDGIRGAAEELKRRILDPYEDQAIIRNGDINAK